MTCCIIHALLCDMNGDVIQGASLRVCVCACARVCVCACVRRDKERAHHTLFGHAAACFSVALRRRTRGKYCVTCNRLSERWMCTGYTLSSAARGGSFQLHMRRLLKYCLVSSHRRGSEVSRVPSARRHVQKVLCPMVDFIGLSASTLLHNASAARVMPCCYYTHEQHVSNTLATHYASCRGGNQCQRSGDCSPSQAHQTDLRVDRYVWCAFRVARAPGREAVAVHLFQAPCARQEADHPGRPRGNPRRHAWAGSGGVDPYHLECIKRHAVA